MLVALALGSFAPEYMTSQAAYGVSTGNEVDTELYTLEILMDKPR